MSRVTEPASRPAVRIAAFRVVSEVGHGRGNLRRLCRWKTHGKVPPVSEELPGAVQLREEGRREVRIRSRRCGEAGEPGAGQLLIERHAQPLGALPAERRELPRQAGRAVRPGRARVPQQRTRHGPGEGARAAAQGGREIKVYTVPAKMTMTQALEWRKKFYDTGKDTTEDLPRYQLILGDLDQVPLAIQQVQAADNYVGRLAFSDDKGYKDYVEKVLRWEQKPSSISQARSLLHTVHDQTAATDSGYRALVSPGLTVARKRRESKQFNASEIVELGDQTIPNMSDLLDEITKPDPAMLFTLSHGLGPPRGGWRSPEEQRRRQGAMSFGREGKLTGEDLRARPFLPGGVWFMFACYGAGTPDRSRFHHWLAHLAQLGKFRGSVDAVLAGLPRAGERPFVAELPRTLLANPDGPLAFLGHLDLAWSYAFMEMDDSKAKRPAKFYNVLRSLVRGDRAGIAARELVRTVAPDQTDSLRLYVSAPRGTHPQGLTFSLRALDAEGGSVRYATRFDAPGE